MPDNALHQLLLTFWDEERLIIALNAECASKTFLLPHRRRLLFATNWTNINIIRGFRIWKLIRLLILHTYSVAQDRLL